MVKLSVFQVLFKANLIFKYSQGKFNFQVLFKTALHIQVVFKSARTLQLSVVMQNRYLNATIIVHTCGSCNVEHGIQCILVVRSYHLA